MTRIIAGRAGGTVLEVPARGTRPTSDRVRESLFGALESAGALDGTRVADLYAGSGALGLEALSRGAASLDLVERSAPAAGVARRNVERVTRATGRRTAHVHQQTAAAFLTRAVGPYDLMLLDPPYDLSDTELSGILDRLVPLLADDAVVIVERSSRSAEPSLPPGLSMMRSRRYGDTTMWWVQPRSESQSR